MKGIAALLAVGLALTACTALPSGDDPTGIEGMSPADVITALEAIGLECSDPGKSFDAVYISFSCVETPNVSVVEGNSNTIDEMAFVTIRVDDGDRDTAKRLAEAVLSIPYEGSDPEAAMAWLSERLASEACVQAAADPPDCKEVFGAARLSLQIGAESSPSIRIDLTGLDVSPTPGPGETG
jgi:hypothetical protein